MRTRQGLVEPDVYIRIVHIAQVGRNNVSVATYREQTVEIAVESKGMVKNDPAANVTRRTTVERIVSAISLSGGTRCRPRSQNPRGLPNFQKRQSSGRRLRG
jgi:hypothetical protein